MRAVLLVLTLLTFTGLARADAPKLGDVVKLEFPEGGYTFTLAEAAQGVKLAYKVVVSADQAGVTAFRTGPSFAEPPGPSGLYPHERITGGGQLYDLQDFGLAVPPKYEPKPLKKGTYAHSFAWDGRNWTGPSDFGNPKGKPFPAGTYEVTVTLVGEVVTEKGKTPYEIKGKAKLVLK